jgi:hypothetical protein
MSFLFFLHPPLLYLQKKKVVDMHWFSVFFFLDLLSTDVGVLRRCDTGELQWSTGKRRHDAGISFYFWNVRAVRILFFSIFGWGTL